MTMTQETAEALEALNADAIAAGWERFETQPGETQYADQVERTREPRIKYLGLAGQAGAGKDYCWLWLIERSLFTVKRVGYADQVRMEIAQLFGMSCETEKQLFTKPYSHEVRRLLQWWGTDLRRAADPDYWVKQGIGAAEAIAAEATEDLLIVFTDVRFENEAAAIHELGGKVFEVVAPAAVRAARTGGLVTPSHASEDIDFEVDELIENGVDGAEPVVTPEMAQWLEMA